MIAGLNMPHNIIGHLALEAQMRQLQGSKTLRERARLEQHLNLSTIDALTLLLDGVPQEYVFGNCFLAKINDTLMRTYLGVTLARWDQNRPYYLSPLGHNVSAL